MTLCDRMYIFLSFWSRQWGRDMHMRSWFSLLTGGGHVSAAGFFI